MQIREKTLLKIRLKREIEELKKRLEAGDYKRLKNIEFAEIGQSPPYSWVEIHAEAQPVRDKINELQAQLEEAESK